MAVVGIGVDICQISRLARALDKAPKLREKIFTPAERDLPISSLAARFAAKEAVGKALGNPGQLRFAQVEVTGGRGTAPAIVLSAEAAKRAQNLGISRWFVSLSHDADTAIAMVIAESE